MGPIAVAALAAILIGAPSASGQAAVDQYVPTGTPGGGSAGGGTLVSPYNPQGPVGAARQAVKPDVGSGDGGGGSLPLTGYPATRFIWIVLAVLVAAALLRVAASVKDRRRFRGTS